MASTLESHPVGWVKGLHINAAYLASSICPITECDVQLGWGTKQLPIENSGQILQRWCVEVIYTENQTKEKGKAAVEVVLIDRDNDNPNNWKIVSTEYGADCGAMN